MFFRKTAPRIISTGSTNWYPVRDFDQQLNHISNLDGRSWQKGLRQFRALIILTPAIMRTKMLNLMNAKLYHNLMKGKLIFLCNVFGLKIFVEFVA